MAPRSGLRLRWVSMGLGAALWALASSPAQAFLSDDEARKAILELRARVLANDEANKARVAELSSSQALLLEQLTALRRSLLELNNQLEAARAERAQLRGANEQLAREVAELQKRSRDVSQAMDERLRQLEPVKVAVDGRDFLAEPEEKRAHDEAMAALRASQFERAQAQIQAFLLRWPASGYGPSLRFWLGNALYAQRDHKEAMATFRAFASAHPTHPRAPEALLGLAGSQAESKDVRGARRTLEDLIKAYPQSEAAQAARERLPNLR
jgi:tol-pal system protein YbgF